MFSSLPTCLGQFPIQCDEFVYHVYMPIKMADASMVRVPPHLSCFWPLVEQVMFFGGHADKYMYLTVKKMHISNGQWSNRSGWHLDGFGSADNNFIWSDCLPTEFVHGDFSLSDGHDESMLQMTLQAEGREITTYPAHSLLALDPNNVHRVAVCEDDCVRTFCKISLSDSQYNLRGNAHNYLFDYDWPMVERKCNRNHPVGSAT